jgi:hypothetical protein
MEAADNLSPGHTQRLRAFLNYGVLLFNFKCTRSSGFRFSAPDTMYLAAQRVEAVHLLRTALAAAESSEAARDMDENATAALLSMKETASLWKSDLSTDGACCPLLCA